MKKSSLLALVGVGLFTLNNLYYLVVNSLEAWQYDWYQTLGYVWNILVLASWILIGQFFLTLYKKSK